MLGYLKRIKELIYMNSRQSELTNHKNLHIRETFELVSNLVLHEPVYMVLLIQERCIAGAFPIEGFEKIENRIIDEQTLSQHLNIEKNSVDGERSIDVLLVSENKLTQHDIKLLEKITTGIKVLIEKFDRYNTIIDSLNSIDEGVSIADKEGNFVFANKSCLEITGLTEEEMIEKRVDRYTKEKPIFLSILEDGKSRIDFEYYLTIRDKTLHLINSAYPVFDTEQNIKGAIDVFRSIKRSRKLVDDLAGHHAIYNFDSIIGTSPSLNKVKKEAKSYANSDKSILLIGESGVGKELFAQAIHNYSYRSDAPFVAINCANLPTELIDSELFGYAEGAFTGARKNGKQGKFEFANGGTLFLDEVGELPIQLQAKLLRVLETKEISRIGSNKKVKVDIRIIAATNRNINQMVKEGRFRMDLLYRLGVLEIIIPPLRNRKEDIAVLTKHFLEKIAYDMNLYKKSLSDDALKLMIGYEWPGNVRELENVIARAVFLSMKDEIDEGILSQCCFNTLPEPAKHTPSMNTVTKQHFIETYNACGKNKKKTAEVLGVSRPTVYRLLKKYNVI